MSDTERIALLESMLGIQFLGMTGEQLRAELKPENELPGGKYPLLLSDYQLRVAFADALAQIEQLKAKLAALEARPTGSVQAGGTSLPLSAPDGAVAVREMYQSDPKRVTVGMLADMQRSDAVVHNEAVAFLGEVGIGGLPIKNVPLVLRRGAEVVAMRRVSESSTQEKAGDRIRLHSFSASDYDNGMRMIKGAVWIDGVMHISSTDPIVDIVAMDSQGKVSKSRGDYRNGNTALERGQVWCVREDLDNPEGPMLWIQGCAAGLGIGVESSTQSMNDHNPNPNDRQLVLVKPIKASRTAQPPDLVNV